MTVPATISAERLERRIDKHIDFNKILTYFNTKNRHIRDGREGFLSNH
jgi:hypothetical protein